MSSSIYKKIQEIQIISIHLAQDILAGSYKSAFKGKGLEFEEVREYQPGDEMRSIDWNVTARMQHPFVKQFREERDLTVLLLVDASASTRFQSKNELIAEIGAVLAFSAIRNNDKVGLLLFTDQVEKYIPPKKGSKHVVRLIRELLAFHPVNKGSNLANALTFLGNLQFSSICFLISDFLFETAQKPLALAAAKHELISICISDPYEKQFPDLGLVHLEDNETGQKAVFDSRLLSSELERLQQAHKKVTERIGTDFLKISTKDDYVHLLKQFFKLRAKRR